MYQSILVPYDGSPLSARTLPFASAIANHLHAQVHVVIVHDPSAYIPFVPGEVAIPVFDVQIMETHRQHDQELLDAAVAELTRNGVEATGSLLEGTIVEALEEFAQESGVDLTIMGTHGRSGFQRLRLGSVATSFLTRATMPVLLVPGSDSFVATSLPTGTLLCPLDGSPFAEAMLPYARTFAKAFEMPMHLLGVSLPHSIPMAPFGVETLLADTQALEAEGAAREEYLSRIANECVAGTTWSAVSDMSVAHAIHDAAVAHKAGVIAMATHGRGGFKRMVLGSVTDEVLRGSTLPVLVYRHHKT